MTPQIGVSPPLKDMVDRFTHIFFGRWFVLLFFGAQGYWQVKGLLRDTTAGRVVASLCWIALGVLLVFISWKIGWDNLRALGTKAQRRRRRLAVLAAVPLTVAGGSLLLKHDPYLGAIGALFMLLPIIGLVYLVFRWYTRDSGIPQPFVPRATSD